MRWEIKYLYSRLLDKSLFYRWKISYLNGKAVIFYQERPYYANAYDITTPFIRQFVEKYATKI